MILAGGRATRLGGLDKATLQIGGRPLIDRVLEGLDNTDGLPTPVRVILVGPTPTGHPRPHLDVVREDPPFSGPLAAVDAGVRAVGTAWVGILAVDIPHGPAALARLIAAAPEGAVTGLVAADERGRLAPAALLRTTETRARLVDLARRDGLANQPLRALFQMAGVTPIVVSPELLADVDTANDLERDWDHGDPRMRQPKLTP